MKVAHTVIKIWEDKTAINYNWSVLLLHPNIVCSCFLSLLLPRSLLSFISQSKNDIQKHDYTITDWKPI